MRPLVVLPTYQEAENIEVVLRRVRRAEPRASILVVDDNSPDGTADLAEALGVELGKISVLRRPGKAGLGAAYRAGFQRGLADGFDVLVEMDADLSHDPDALPALIDGLLSTKYSLEPDGPQLVIGSRYIPGGSIPDWSLHRRLLSRWGNRYAAAVLGLAVNDATSGFRAYRSDAMASIDFHTVRADGYGFQIEMAYRVAREGGRIVEVPISFSDRVKGESKMSGRIVVEALVLVTWWGIRDRIRR